MSDRHANRPDAFATCVAAAILCLAAVSAPPEASSAPASPVGTNAPAATVGNTNEPATSAEASETNTVHRSDYASFKIIHERNIFNANRSRRREGPGERTRPAKVETFSLVGTMSYAKGDFAF